MARTLRLTSPHARGGDVKNFQRALNARARQRRLPLVTADGDYGPASESSYHDVGYFLGLAKSTLRRGATVGAQRIIADPVTRNPAQLARARSRREELRRRQNDPIGRALAWCGAQIGKTESPTGSNRGPLPSLVQREFGFDGQPWCGAFVGYALRKHGGVAVGREVVYVPGLRAAAKQGRAGFGGFFSRPQRGDLMCLFRDGHVEIVESVGGDQCVTIGGNTSAGSAGSQNNGGGVYRRKRRVADATGFARPRW